MSEQHKLAAAQRGSARTKEMEQKVVQAMQAIQADMQANGGIYPHNGGAVSMAELARRAGISESSFYKKEPDNLALKERADLWLDTLKKKETVGRMRVRKTFAQRAESWEKKYKALEQRHLRTELELQSLQAEAQKLRDDNTVLLEQLRVTGASKVTPIPKRK
jgi:AcrR family transcriptional regulator